MRLDVVSLMTVTLSDIVFSSQQTVNLLNEDFNQLNDDRLVR